MAPALTLDERRHLTRRGATVFERAALLAAAPGEPPSSDEPGDPARAAWRAWVQAFSPGDPDALERRISWEGLDVTHLTRALGDDWLPATAAAWVDHLEGLLAVASMLAAERRALAPGTSLPERALFDTPPPFLDLLIPVVRLVRARVRAGEDGAAALELLGPGAWHSLERALLRETARHAELALLDAFREARAARALDYDQFVQAMLDGDYAAFLHQHAVLARHLAGIAARTASAMRELLVRLQSDRGAIADVLGASRDPGRVVEIEPALSDPHAGGRRVAILQFESGLRVVYKPRPVAIECAFGRWLAWAASRGLTVAPRVPRAVDRGDYGWTEAVDQETFETPAQVGDYYRRAGALLCLAYVFRARDLHMENIVATRGGPVAVDLELLLQPPGEGESLAGDGAATHPGPGRRSAPDDHCLASGLLTFTVSRDGQTFDIGGLRGRGRGVAARPRRVWHALEQDTIHHAEDASFDSRVGNAVVLGGITQMPDDHAEEVMAGFGEAYEFLRAHRDEMLAEGGALSPFAGLRARVVPRATVQYGTLLHVLAQPRYQTDGRRWSLAHEALNRAFNRRTDRPRAWSAVEAERRALEQLDVPYFDVAVSGTALRIGDAVVDGYFAESGMAAAVAGLRRLSEADLASQRQRIARALDRPVDRGFRVPPPDAQPGQVTDAADAILQASWIARELIACDRNPASAVREREPNGADWVKRHSLYEGTLGPTVFLASLAAITGEAEHAAAARQRLTMVRAAASRSSASDGLGAAVGLGSLVYGLTLSACLLGDGTALAAAAEVAMAIDDRRVDADAALDVYGGAAGAVLGLLALHAVTADRRVLARACRCGDRLLRAVPGVQAPATSAGGSPRLVGFAHGVAGVAHALGRLAVVTGEPRYAAGARAGWRHVCEQFQAREGNWPIAAGAPGGAATDGSMLAWCHGAPGIVLAASFASETLLESDIYDQVQGALRALAAAPVHAADHACCGNLGRVEALATAGRRLMRRDSLEAARRLAAVALHRARTHGHFGLGGGAFECRVDDPGFFRGLSGIGYTLLRLAAPDRVPSVLAFEAPLRCSTPSSIGR